MECKWNRTALPIRDEGKVIKGNDQRNQLLNSMGYATAVRVRIWYEATFFEEFLSGKLSYLNEEWK